MGDLVCLSLFSVSCSFVRNLDFRFGFSGKEYIGKHMSLMLDNFIYFVDLCYYNEFSYNDC